MAHMIPPTPPPPGPGCRAEGLVYEALRDQLDDDHFVYNRFKFIAPQTASEGESDFLVLHREKGLLAIECKGKGVRRNGAGEWVRIWKGAEEPLKEAPFDQAQRTIKTLVKALSPRMTSVFPKLRRFPFVHGHAVVFPSALREEACLPLDLPAELLWDAADLNRLGECVARAFSYWRRAAVGVRPLEQWELKSFRKKVLHPQIGVVDCLSAAIQADERALVQLSDEQRHLVEMWLDNPKIRVTGGAGTGKTLLALEAARQLAEQGEHVLLLCFNRALKEYIKSRVEAFDPGEGSIQVSHFHGLCVMAHYKARETEPKVPDDVDRRHRFWKEEAPYFLLEAIDKGAMERPTTLIVDEGQDFCALWWDVLAELLGAEGDRRMLVFYDPSQGIFGDPCCVPEMPTMKLNQNYRNTRRIAAVVSELGAVPMTPSGRCPEGEPPEVRKQESEGRSRAQIAELLKHFVKHERLLPDQIALLTPHRRERSLFSGLTELGGYRLAGDPNDRAGAVLHTTIGAFKGLESDVVVLADVDPDDPRCSRNALYVAVSRAKHRLVVFSRSPGVLRVGSAGAESGSGVAPVW